MYLPKHFEVTDEATLYAFMAANAFATLVSVIDGAPFATHLPLIIDRDAEGRATLLGHVALGNQHRTAFDGEHESLAVFQGPHSYVSPAWYAERPAVPTWNYAAVHAYGRPRLLNAAATAALVDRLTAYFDPAYAASLAEADRGHAARLLPGIVGFSMLIERLDGKYKLSQNRSEADQRGVIAALGPADELAAMMAQRLQPDGPA